MGESNGAWGELASRDDGLAEVWDTYERIPEPGANAALDAFVESKSITHSALVRLGARLSTPTTLAVSFPGGIKFRDLVTDRRWSYAGSTWRELKLVRHGPEPASTVIVAEGESDGAWLADRYPVDVAVLPCGADPRPHAAAYAEQLRGYELVLLGQDDDRAGEEGAAQLAALLPQAQRFKPPANDWCDTETPPPLPEPDSDYIVGGLRFENLSPIFDTGVPDPEVLFDDMIYTEGVHWISGHPGCGKTTLSMHIAIEVMGGGRHVVWLDYEGGLRSTLRRLIACDCPPELAIERFHYAAWPAKAASHFEAVAERWPGALIVMDSASKSLQQAGLDENSPSEVTMWAAEIVQACKAFALPVIVIDHVAKTANRESRYARGAGSKQADSDVAWYVEKLIDFNRESIGAIGVYQQKDREGWLPHSSWFQLGDGAGSLTCLRLDSEPDPDVTDVGPPI